MDMQVTFINENHVDVNDNPQEPERSEEVPLSNNNSEQASHGNDWRVDDGLQQSPSQFTPMQDGSMPFMAQNSLSFRGYGLSPSTSSPNVHEPQLSPSLSIPRSSNQIDFILNPMRSDTSLAGDHHSDTFRENVITSEVYQESPQSQGSRIAKAVETDHEIAFLLRHYCEYPGKW